MKLKKIIKSVLSKMGYEIFPSLQQRIPYNVFLNITHAYEQRINENSVVKINNNDLRPKLLSRLLGTPPSEAYFIIHALAETKFIEGDVCEFGVAQGETSALIANEINDSSKIIHLFDSFVGLPKPTEKDQLKDDIYSLGSMDAYAGKMSCPEEMVLARMKSISFPKDRFVIHKGFIDQVLENDSQLPNKVSFAFVDFDFYEPIKLALEFLHQVTHKGSIVIVDDYNFFSTGAKTAVDEFVDAMNANNKYYDLLIPNTHFGYFAIIKRVN